MRAGQAQRAVALAVLATLLLSSRARAQNVGDPFELDVRILGNEVFVGFDSDSDAFLRADVLGGVTLFAAGAPGGPPLARLAYPSPLGTALEGVPGAVFRSVPTGTYYLVAVFGIVSVPSVPTSSWTRADVGLAPPCATPPGAALIRNEETRTGSPFVRLWMNSVARCASSFLVEAGSSPGQANLARFEQDSQVLISGAVPPGGYYVRVRGRNQHGVGPYSELMPVHVPACPAEAPGPPSNLNAQVIGNVLTLSWTVVTPAGRPPTFAEAILHHVQQPGQPPPLVLLPIGAATTITATVPSGSYNVSIAVGNSCGKSYSSPVAFTVP